MDNPFKLIQQAPQSFRDQIGPRPGQPGGLVSSMPAIYVYLDHAQDVALDSADNLQRIAYVVQDAGDHAAARDVEAEADHYLRIVRAIEALRL